MYFSFYLKIKICLQNSETFVFLCDMQIPFNGWQFNVYTMPLQNLVPGFRCSAVYYLSHEWFEVGIQF